MQEYFGSLLMSIVMNKVSFIINLDYLDDIMTDELSKFLWGVLGSKRGRYSVDYDGNF